MTSNNTYGYILSMGMQHGRWVVAVGWSGSGMGWWWAWATWGWKHCATQP